MALLTAIVRDGQPRTIRWGWWHVECITHAAKAQSGVPMDTPLLNAWSDPRMQGTFTIQYAVGYRDPSDGEVLILEPGDTLHVWRDR